MPDVVVVPSSYILFLSRILIINIHCTMLRLLDVYNANEKTYITCTYIKYTEKIDIYKWR